MRWFLIISRKILVGLTCLLLALGGGFFVFKKTLVELLLTREIIRSDTKIRKVRVDWFSAWPNTRLTLHHVYISGTNPAKRDDVAFIQQARVEANIWHIITHLKKEFAVESVELDSVVLNFEEDAHGRQNFRLFAGKDPPPKHKASHIAISRLHIRNAEYRYRSIPKKRWYAVPIDTALIQLDIYPDNLIIHADAKGRTSFLSFGGFRALENQPFGARLHLDYSKQNHTLHFDTSCALHLAGTNLRLSGNMNTTRKQLFNLHFKADNGHIGTIFSLFPAKAGKILDKFDIGGRMALEGSIVGRDDGKRNPHFALKFRCAEGSFRNQETGADVTGLSFRGQFTNGKSHTSRTTALMVDTIIGRIGERPFYGSLTISNFEELHVNGRLKAQFFFPDLLRFFGMKLDAGAKGEAAVDVQVRGMVQNLTNASTLDSVNYHGYIELSDVSFHTAGLPLRFANLYSRLDLARKHFVLERVHGVINHQPFNGTAVIRNVSPFIFGRKKPLDVDMALVLKSFHIDRFLSDMQSMKDTTKHRQKRPDWPAHFDLPDWLNVDLHLKVNECRYRQAVFETFQARVSLQKKVLQARQIVLKNDRHALSLDAFLDASQPHRNDWATTIRCRSADVVGLLRNLGLVKKPPTKELSARLVFNMSGRMDKHVPKPKAQIRLALDSAEILGPNRKIYIHGVQCRAHLDERHLLDYRNAPLVIDSITGFVDRYDFNARFVLDDWIAQRTHLTVSSHISFPVFLNYFHLESIKDARGLINFQTEINGRLNQWMHPDSVLAQDFKGVLKLHNLGFVFVERDLALTGVDGGLSYDENGVKIHQIIGRLGSSDFLLRGEAKDALSYFYKGDKRLKADVTYEADTLHIEELLSTNKKKLKESRRLTLPGNTDLRLRARVKHCSINRLVMRDIKAELSVVDRMVTCHDLTLHACGGKLQFRGTVAPPKDDSLAVRMELFVMNVQVKQALEELEEFHQKFITSEQIDGKLTAQMYLDDRLPVSLSEPFERLNVSLFFTVTDGMLRHFKPLEAAHPFLNRKLTAETPFVMQGKNITLRNGVLTIPHLELKSNLFDVLFTGAMRTGDGFDYHLAIIPLAGKRRHLQPDLFHARMQNYARTMLVFSIEGKDDDYRVHYNKQAALAHFMHLLPRLDVYRHLESFAKKLDGG